MTRTHPARAGLVSGICLVLAGITAWQLTPRPEEPVVSAIPAAEEIDSLSRYLAPGQPAPQLDDYAAFLPARRVPRYDPPAVDPQPPAPQAPAPSTNWELSAIMIAGARPVAIINDQMVVAGATLPDGAVVLEIGRGHVVIREPNGTRRRLELAAG